MKLDVVLIAQEVRPSQVLGRTAIVIDVLRATSSITTALANGCQAVRPVVSTEEAFALAQISEPGTFLLTGERGGLKVEGFDLGNSPREYSADVVAAKTIIMTTTNGTLAIKNSSPAKTVLLACLLNGRSVARRAVLSGDDITMVCSGTEGIFTLEDAYCAGMLAEEISRVAETEPTDMALACRLIYQRYCDDPLGLMESAIHGQKLRRIGFGEDLVYCSQKNVLAVVPVLRGDSVVAL